VGRDAGVLKTRDGRWEGMLAFIEIKDGRWEGMLHGVFKH
jgi:hypothetical protein